MAKQFRIGHTGITWGYRLDQVDAAVKDVAELGYHAYETFGPTLEEYEQKKPGGFGALLARYDIPLGSAYCSTRFIDPADAKEDIERVTRWAKLAKSLGATTIVLQAAGHRPAEPYTEFRAMADVFSEIGRRVQDVGLIAAIHPHTGTLIETREEIDAVMTSIDPRSVFFAPDTGQIAKGGSDILKVLKTYGSLVRHVHLKDYGGGEVKFDEEGREIDPTGYAGYVPVGQGVVDMPTVFNFLEGIDYKDWVMVELDGTPRSPRPPREAAAMSKRYLQEQLGQAFRT